MTLEEFKTGFLNRSICIYAPTNEEVDAIKNAMISSGWFSTRGSSYDACDYPYLICRFDHLTDGREEARCKLNIRQRFPHLNALRF